MRIVKRKRNFEEGNEVKIKLKRFAGTSRRATDYCSLCKRITETHDKDFE